MSHDINDPSIELFADVVRRYCAWAEGEFHQPRAEMQRARQLLAELYLAVINLPNLEIEEKENFACISHDECLRIFRKFGSLPIDQYWDVFNPLEDTEPVLNSLADDLADIYHDVKAGLILFEANHFSDAVWDWRFNFQIHWGHHLVGAQRTIHEYLSGENL
jgi:hypothetical protein